MLKRRNCSFNKDPLIQFEKDLHQFKSHMHFLFHNKDAIKDSTLLRKISQEIIALYEDAISIEKILPEAHDIYHFIATPIGAPYVSEMTMLQAAIDFSYQDPQRSSIKKILHNFIAYNKNINNELLDILDFVSDEIRISLANQAQQ